MMVSVTDTAIDEYAMVIAPGNAAFTHTAVLGSSRLWKLACCTDLAGVKYGMIVRVQSHVFRMILGGYEARIGICGKI